MHNGWTVVAGVIILTANLSVALGKKALWEVRANCFDFIAGSESNLLKNRLKV